MDMVDAETGGLGGDRDSVLPARDCGHLARLRERVLPAAAEGGERAPVVGKMACPFCLAARGEQRLALRLAARLVELASFGNVELLAQTIEDPGVDYRLWCHVRGAEFRASLDEVGGDHPYGCPHCARIEKASFL